MSHSAKSIYYITKNKVFIIKNNKLEILGDIEQTFNDFLLKKPKKILLGADVYEIFINDAEANYLPKTFIKNNRNCFTLYFPHLNIEDFNLFFEKPKFSKPYIGIAIDKVWLKKLEDYLVNHKFYNIDIQPLSTFLYHKNFDNNEFSCKENSFETSFIKLNGDLHMILRKYFTDATDTPEWIRYIA